MKGSKALRRFGSAAGWIECNACMYDMYVNGNRKLRGPTYIT